MNQETRVTEFLTIVTKEWVAYSSEGVSFRGEVHEIARAHGAEAEILLQADSAVLTVHEDNHIETVTVISAQDITRLDRLTELKRIINAARQPDADLKQLKSEIVAVSTSPAPYPEWAKALGIVLFTIGFSVNVQATWDEVGFAALTGVLVGLLVLTADRFQRISFLSPFVASVMVATTVLLIFNNSDVQGGPILLMIPSLFFFIPGDILSASMFEIGAGRITVGAVQFVNSILVLLMLFLGVVVGVAITGTDTVILFAAAVPADFPDIVPWLGWALFAFGFMLAFSAPMRQYGWILLITLVAFGVVQLGTVVSGEVIGTYLAAAVMMVLAWFISRDPSRPPLMVLALSGFFVLTVGALGLEGFTALVSGVPVDGFTDLFKMLTIGMAIALGLLSGATLIWRVPE